MEETEADKVTKIVNVIMEEQKILQIERYPGALQQDKEFFDLIYMFDESIGEDKEIFKIHQGKQKLHLKCLRTLTSSSKTIHGFNSKLR